MHNLAGVLLVSHQRVMVVEVILIPVGAALIGVGLYMTAGGRPLGGIWRSGAGLGDDPHALERMRLYGACNVLLGVAIELVVAADYYPKAVATALLFLLAGILTALTALARFGRSRNQPGKMGWLLMGRRDDGSHCRCLGAGVLHRTFVASISRLSFKHDVSEWEGDDEMTRRRQL